MIVKAGNKFINAHEQVLANLWVPKGIQMLPKLIQSSTAAAQQDKRCGSGEDSG